MRGTTSFGLQQEERAAGDGPGKTSAAPHAAGASRSMISSIRDARNKHQIKPKDQITLHIDTHHDNAFHQIEGILAKQVNAPDIVFTDTSVSNTIAVVIGKDKFYIETERPVDTGAQKEQLLKDLDYYKKFLESVNKKLSNERFVQSARPDVVQLEQKKKLDAEEKIRAIEDSLKNL